MPGTPTSSGNSSTVRPGSRMATTTCPRATRPGGRTTEARWSRQPRRPGRRPEPDPVTAAPGLLVGPAEDEARAVRGRLVTPNAQAVLIRAFRRDSARGRRRVGLD